jgi:molybdopterin-biosynthesis enzyme MoeA-like protein
MWAAGDIGRAACTFPTDAQVLESPLGGVPGFVLRNVYVLPGAPQEMRAMFDAIDFHRATEAIHSESVTCAMEEHRITDVLRRFDEVHGDVRLGSYPQVGASPPLLTLTLTSRDPLAVRRAAQWVRHELDRIDV